MAEKHYPMMFWRTKSVSRDTVTAALQLNRYSSQPHSYLGRSLGNCPAFASGSFQLSSLRQSASPVSLGRPDFEFSCNLGNNPLVDTYQLLVSSEAQVFDVFQLSLK